MVLSTTSRLSFLLIAGASVLAGCGSTEQQGRAYPPPPVACFDTIKAPEPPPSLEVGAACSAVGAPESTAMAVVMMRSLHGLRASGSQVLHAFFSDVDPDLHSRSGAVLMRGDFILGAGVGSRSAKDGAKGEAAMEIAALRRDGTPLFTYRIGSEYNNGFVDARLFGNARGIFAYSYQSYPFVDGMEVITSNGDKLGFIDGFRPIADPDAAGYIAVREAEGIENRTYWLNPCNGELRETNESGRDFRTSAVAMGSRLVYTDESVSALVVESADSVRHINTGDSTGLPHFAIFDAHPSGWVLLTTKEPASFLAVHIDTEEIRKITIKIPPELRRYDAFTAGPAPGAFDSNAQELRVTSLGEVILPLRDQASAHLYLSPDGAAWQPLGEAIGNVYLSKGIEAGGSFAHVGNAYAVSLPAWSDPPAGEERVDYQSTQLVRPASSVSEIAEQSPLGSHYNHFYELSLDGGCLATAPIGGGDIAWLNAVTKERFTFPMPETNYTTPALAWHTGPGVTIYSLF